MLYQIFGIDRGSVFSFCNEMIDSLWYISFFMGWDPLLLKT